MRLGGLSLVLPADTESIVDVNIIHSCLPLASKLVAGWAKRINSESAIVSQPSVVCRSWEDTEPVGHFNNSICVIVLVISNSVSYHESFKVRGVSATLVKSAISDVPIDSFNKARNINSSI